MPAIKVLHFIPSFGPGGAERQLALIASALVREGVEVHVAYVAGGPNLARLEGKDVRLHSLSANGNYDPMLAWRVLQLVRSVRPDIVQTWITQMDILAGSVALLCRLPLIVSERSSALAYLPGWKPRLRQVIGLRAARIIANSRSGLDYWRPFVPEVGLKLVRNCVTPPQHEADVPADALGQQLAGRRLVMFAGRLTAGKNLPNLVDALAIVGRRYPEVAMVLFGEGSDHDDIVRRIGAAGMVGRIVVAGYSTSLSAWMARAEVFVSVSLYEGHPNVVIEAAAAGCPLVISDISSHRELFDADSAAFVPANLPTVIADAIFDVLDDPHSARERAAHARAIVAHWTVSAAAKAYRSIYESLMTELRRPKDHRG